MDSKAVNILLKVVVCALVVAIFWNFVTRIAVQEPYDPAKYCGNSTQCEGHP